MMLRILPSQAVSTIGRLYLFAAKGDSDPKIHWNSASNVATILALLEGIPDELLVVDAEASAQLVEAKAVMATFIDNAHAHGSSSVPLPGKYVTSVFEILSKCPDRAVPAAITALSFIPDAAFRESLRDDISEVEAALSQSEWKSATVVGGSVIEALLWWALDQQRTKAQIEGAKLPSNVTKQPLENWDLHQYVEVASILGITKPSTAALVRLAKDFRNLVHPGRAIRLAQKCDRGTARAVAAGLDLVIRDLTP
jgi:hypothetical protein